MACHVIGKSLTDTASLAYNAQVLAHYTAAATTVEDKAVAFFFHRLPFFIILLFLPAMVDDGFRYGMQRYDKLNLCLLSLLADISLSVR